MVSLLRLLPWSPRVWLRMALAWWRYGPGFAFLGEVAAVRFPERLALLDEEGQLTFAQLWKESLELAGWLRQQGVGRGQLIGLSCRNHRSFLLGLLAITRLGADVMPLACELPETVLRRYPLDRVVREPDCLGRLAVHLAPARSGQLVVLTSGTTGIAKGVRRRPGLRQLLPTVRGLLHGLPLRPGRPLLVAIPLYHGYGLACAALGLALGAPLVLRRRYEIAPLVECAPNGVLVTVPTLLSRWLRSEPSVPSLAGVITGSAPLEAGLCRQLLDRLGPRLFNLYGSSEAGVIALAGPEQLRRSPGCVGRPLPGNRVRLLEGRILVNGPLAPPGWYETGDLGRWDEHGHLFVCGRADSMIVSGGENVYPSELEEVLVECPGVLDSAVVAVDDPEFGRRLAAAVVGGVEEEEVLDWLRGRLERHKLPRSVRRLESIPRNALGKLDRPELLRLLSGGEIGPTVERPGL
ncbi:MAG: AMP-binding protein [Candidatus Eremiobacteraeota bacterium]|nr:AMP-binding protein [Candidatus Eremiobacteraeota bacterium]